MNRKYYFGQLIIGFLLFFFATNTINAITIKNDSLSLFQRMDTLLQKKYFEKIYLNTDRPIYSTSDTIFFNAWILQPHTLLPTNKSHLLYVDLINNNNLVTHTAQYQIVQGRSYGQFVLPKVITETGAYRIRAYTRWSKNFGDSTYFEKMIPVWSDLQEEKEKGKDYVWRHDASKKRLLVSKKYAQKQKNKAKDKLDKINQKKKELTYDMDVQFLPESGSIIANTPNNIAIKAVFKDGEGANFEGTIVDHEGTHITDIKISHKGMGHFIFIPQEDKTYFLKTTNKKKFPLPKIKAEGVNFIILSKPQADTIIVSIHGSKKVWQQSPKLLLTVESRGILSENAFQIFLNRPRVIVKIPKKTLLNGIQRITIFDNQLTPLCERIIYVHQPDEAITLDYKTKWEAVSDTEKYFTLNLTPKFKGKKVPSAFAISITNANTIDLAHPTQTICSEMFLSSELHGKIEDPAYYFLNPYDSIAQELDLIMLTHGWRGFKWKTALNKKFIHPVDTGFTLTGKITNLFGKGAKDRRLAVLIKGGNTVIQETVTNTNGKFIFNDLKISGNSMARLQILKQKKGSDKKKSRFGLGITFDKQNNRPFFPVLKQKNLLDKNQVIDNKVEEFKLNIKQEKSEILKLKKKYGVYVLEEVSISAKKEVKGSWKRSKSEANLLIDSLEITKYDPYTSIIDVLKSELPLFNCEKRGVGPKGFVITYDSPHFTYDRKSIHFQVDAQILSQNAIADSSGDSFDDSKNIASTIEEIIRYIPAKQVKAIELLTSRLNLALYDKTDDAFLRKIHCFSDTTSEPTAVVIVITTKNGKGFKMPPNKGGYITDIQGASIARAFYLPKYYPKDPFDQAIFDKRKILFWNPDVLTNANGEIEIEFTVGAFMKNNLQIEIEGMDGNGHFCSQRFPIKLKDN